MIIILYMVTTNQFLVLQWLTSLLVQPFAETINWTIRWVVVTRDVFPLFSIFLHDFTCIVILFVVRWSFIDSPHGTPCKGHGPELSPLSNSQAFWSVYIYLFIWYYLIPFVYLFIYLPLIIMNYYWVFLTGINYPLPINNNNHQSTVN